MSTTIYDLNINEMRKLMRDFHKSLYGRTIFLFAYFIPFTLFITSAIMLLMGEMMMDAGLVTLSCGIFCGFVVTFILGNIYFYSELRKFAAVKNKK
ncbi:MAG: hypothetical protein MJ154_03055 [Candidatus Saccharibacteria bacterium]|nr:hypothetical protein [Candidatus Saccharibacteria bacterium]